MLVSILIKWFKKALHATLQTQAIVAMSGSWTQSGDDAGGMRLKHQIALFA